jgi:hypothetical protein
MGEAVLHMAHQAQRTLCVTKGTGDLLGGRLCGSATPLVADPGGAKALIVQTVKGQRVAMRTQGAPVLIVAAPETGVGILVRGVLADIHDGDDARCVEGLQTGRISHGSIRHEFAAGELRQARAYVGEVLGENDAFTVLAGCTLVWATQ